MTEVPRGNFVWYELLTKDPDGAKSFYTDVIGWGTQQWEGGEQPYSMWAVGERPIGGLMELPEEAKAHGAPSHWLAYVSTPDIAGTTAKAKELGATVLVDQMQIPDVGTMSVMADPHGAVFAAYQPAGETPGSQGKPEHGDMSWHELMSDDYKASFEFYDALFGWDVQEDMDMGEHGIYRIYGQNEIPYGGMMNRPEGMPASAWLMYTTVDDIDATLAKVTANGGQILNGPMEVPGGDRVAQCMDPQGAAFALHESSMTE